MGYDYKLELKLSQVLRLECVRLFNECKEFTTPTTLRDFASVTQLEIVVECIPKMDELDYNRLILNLLKSRNRTSSEPALFDLLSALALEYKNDTRGIRFEDLTKDIRGALLQGENSDQEKDYLKLVSFSTSSDERDADRYAARWIEGAGDDLDELSLRITLAVFHGSAFETIENAKSDLLGMLQKLVPPPPPPDPNNPPPPPPHVPLMHRLEIAGAYETAGKAPDWLRVIELKKPEIASEAISHVWQLYRETKWRQKLIEWLTSYAAGHAADVRTRAAVAAGILAVKDYRFVRDKLLDDWVQKNDNEFRAAIGMALGVLVREVSMTDEVENLLREWSESTEEDKRWAAMRAYIYVGAYCRTPGEAIARWRKIAASEHVAIRVQISEVEFVQFNNPLHMSLMDAMVRFFDSLTQLPEEERRRLVKGILVELGAWIAANDDGAWLGLFMFKMLGAWAVETTEDGESGEAPMLLQLVEDGSDETEYRSQLAGLLEMAMRNGATIIETQELLCVWLDWANSLPDDSPSREARLQTLFKDIIAKDKSGRMRGKLAACLRDCGRNRVAQHILSSIQPG
jgi:hypothetical protein